MLKRLFPILLIIPAALLLMGAGAPLTNPPPITVPDGLSQKDVSNALVTALVTRGWIVDSDKDGTIESTLFVRKHMAKISLTYDTRQVVIKYLDSDNLNYLEKGGAEFIHRNYHNWIQNITNDIRLQLSLASRSQN